MLIASAVFSQNHTGSEGPGETNSAGPPAIDNESAAAENLPARLPDELDLSFTFSDEEAAQADEAQDVQVFGFWALVRMVLVLALVVGLIYGLYYLLKRRQGSREEDGSFISLLSSQSLPGGKQLHIIDVAGHVYLLGAADGGINLITELDDKITIDELRLQASRKRVQSRSFQQLMGGLFSRDTDSPTGAAPAFSGDPESETENRGSTGGDNALFSFVHQQREKLRKL